MCSHRLWTAVMLGCALGAGAHAQAQDENKGVDFLRNVFAASATTDKAKSALHITSDSVVRLLKGVELEPVLLSDDESGSGESELGVRYKFRKQLAEPIALGKKERSGLVLSFASRGTVAVDADDNPEDLLETSLDLSLFGTRLVGHDAFSDLEARARAGDADAKKQVGTLRVKAATLEASLTPKYGSHPLAASVDPEYLKFIADNPEAKLVRRDLWTWHVDLHTALESNQRFTDRQFAFGLQAGGQFWSDREQTNAFNLFEYPFVLTRWLTGDEPPPEAKAVGWPTLQAAIEIVDPVDDDVRAAVGEEDPFWRARLDIGTTSRFGTLGGRVLKASLDWRLWYELDAPDAIEDIDQDHFEWFQFALTDDKSGVFASYAAGRLPFDVDDSSVFSLGWKISQ